MTLLQRLFGRPDRGPAPRLYSRIVERGRLPHWYRDGGVPDTIEGRFEMIATILTLVMLRLEAAPEAAAANAALAECFVADMEDQLREIGIGDLVVGKHIGKMMSLLGGRLGALRDGLATGEIGPVLVRNLYRGEAPEPVALAHVERALLALRDALAARPVAAILESGLPE